MSIRTFAEIEPIDRQQVEASPPDAGVALVVDDVSKALCASRSSAARRCRRRHALQNVSLTVGRNEIFGILGANGSGKSTLIRVMSTLLIPDSGRVTVFGYDVRADEARVKRLINRVSVEASFFKKLSADGEPALRVAALRAERRLAAARYRQHPGRAGHRAGADQPAAGAALARDAAEGGDRARLSDLAGAAAARRADDRARPALEAATCRTSCATARPARRHDPALHHDMDEAERLCDRIAMLDQGRVVAIDTAQGLKDQVSAALGGVAVSLEDVFIHLTGRALGDEVSDAEAEVA